MNENAENRGHRVPKFLVDGKYITLHQARIISLFVHGLPRKQLAHVLGNSPHTIDTHMDRIYKLLGINAGSLIPLWATMNGFDTKGCLHSVYLFGTMRNLPWNRHEED
ncbi:MAG: hypothetical protein H6601_02130 [Flavobacteriales bacterium]|nr:hypothetical protein [Flavobacteriales bacterium]